MDISADLVDLGRTPIAVVCAGAKSILDIPRTLEFLETQGVCVAAYKADEFPAFFTPSSGCSAPCRVDSPEQAAGLIASSLHLGLNSGTLIGEHPLLAMLFSVCHDEMAIQLEQYVLMLLKEALATYLYWLLSQSEG